MRQAEEAATPSSLRTANLKSFRKAVSERKAGWAVLWASRLRKVWRRDRLSSFMLKQSALDSFWGRLRAEIGRRYPGEVVHVAYGAADFDSSRKGSFAPAPTTSVLKAACTAFGRENVFPVDEYCTTKMSQCCGVKNDTVVSTAAYPHPGPRASRRAGRTRARKARRVAAVAAVDEADDEAGDVRRDVRGLRSCSSCHRIWDRDYNACLNIGECFVQLCKVGSKDPACRPSFLSR